MTIIESQRISGAGSVGRLALLFGLAALAGCSPLSSIEAGACGNLVLEPESGEDCDGFAQGGVSCYAPGTPNECRLDCTGDGTSHPCPTGWACGADLVCRTPSGGFEPVGAPITEDAFQYNLADFDGDKRLDLLSSSPADIRIHYQDPGEVLGQTLAIPTTGTYPGVGDVNHDGIDDFTMNVGLGVGIMLGQKNRTTTPAAFPAVQVPKAVQMPSNTVEQARLVSIGNPTASLLDTVFFVARLAGPVPPKGWYLAGVDVGGGAGKPLDLGTARPLSLDATLPFPSMAKGRIADDPFHVHCEQVAIAFPGKDTVEVHLPCTRGTNGVNISLISEPPPFPVSVKLPAPSRVAGRIFLFDLNRDDHPDLVIPAACGLHCYEIDVAFGLNDGSFQDSVPMTIPMTGGNGMAARYAAVPVGMVPPGSTATEAGFLPLAVGDLDGDMLLDYVDAFSVNFGRLKLSPLEIIFARTFSNPASDAWTDALIADFNANGLPDVIAGASTKPDIDFLNGTGTDAMNPFRITTAAGVDQFALGDFDGDLILDLAFAQGSVVTMAGETATKSVAVAFGQPSGAPASPMTVGHFETIGQILGLNYGFADSMTDLGILYANDTDFFLNLAFGSSIRQIQAPYTLVDYLKGIIHVPLLSMLGRFGGPGSSGGQGSSDEQYPSDLAVLTAGISVGSASLDYRSGLWLAQSDAQGKLGKAAGSPELDMRNVTFNGHTQTLIDAAVADLNQDTVDELLLSLPVASGNPMPGVPPKLTGGLTIARADSGVWKLDPVFAPQESRFFIAFQHGDINVDSYTDVAAIEVDLAMGMAGEVSYTSKIVVFWGTPSSQSHQNGLLDPVAVPAPVSSDPESYFNPISLALLNLDGDSAKEIVTVTAAGVFFVDTDSTTTLKAPTLIEGLPGGSLVSAGDLTGDGVDDLVIGGFGSTYIFRGVPVLK